MSNNWYPQDKEQLSKLLDEYLSKGDLLAKHSFHTNGLIVPHAGYAYSGEIAGKAFALLKGEINKIAIILSPSHYIALRGIASHIQQTWQTALGDINISNIKQIDIPKQDLSQEHAIDNQIPFLQKIGIKNILPILVGEISQDQAKKTAEELSKIKDSIFIISTDLSHFLSYEQALKKDKQTIKAIESLNSKKLLSIENSACGINPLLILIELCKIKDIKPRLIEYKNSGDITGDKSSVVGYCSMVF